MQTETPCAMRNSRRTDKTVQAVFRHAVLCFTSLYVLLRMLFQPSVYVDNTMVAAMASWGEPHPYLIYIGYLNGWLIAALRTLLPQLEWSTVLLFMANTGIVAVTSHCCVRVKEGTPVWRNMVGAGILLAYMAASLLYPYYSLTSAAGIGCGLCWMLYAQREGKWGQFAAAVFFLLFTASLRFDSCLSLLTFCLSVSAYFIWCRRYARLLAPVVAASVVVFVYVLQPLCAEFSPWEPDVPHAVQNAVTINNVRMRFFDYDDRIGMDKLEEYAKEGVSANDIWVFGLSCYQLERRSEPGFFTMMGEIRMRDNGLLPTSFRTFLHRMKIAWQTNHFAIDLWYIWIFIFVLTFIPRPRTLRDPRLAVCAAFVADIALLFLMGRCPFGAVLAVIYTTTPLLLLACSVEAENAGSPPECKACNYGAVALVCVFAAVLTALAPNFSPVRYRYPDPEYYDMVRRECATHPRLNYYIPIFQWGWKTIPTGVFLSSAYNEVPNLLPDKDYIYLAPSVQSELQKRGIPSDLTILLQERSRFIYSRTEAEDPSLSWKMYYWYEHHGIRLHMVKERDLTPEYAVYKMVRAPGGDDVPLKPAP